MQFKGARVVALILLSLVTLVLPVSGMYVAWNWTLYLEHLARSGVVVVVGILSFAIAVRVFWRLVELLALEEGEK